jgi:hypothetical protein
MELSTVLPFFSFDFPDAWNFRLQASGGLIKTEYYRRRHLPERLDLPGQVFPLHGAGIAPDQPGR